MANLNASLSSELVPQQVLDRRTEQVIDRQEEQVGARALRVGAPRAIIEFTTMAPGRSQQGEEGLQRLSRGPARSGRSTPNSTSKAGGETDNQGRLNGTRGRTLSQPKPVTRAKSKTAPSSRSGTEVSSRSIGRRRALIQAYSDEEDDPLANPLANQLAPLRVQDPLSHDLDIDMQLVDISPEHGGSSLQYSTSQNDHLAAPHQAVLSISHLDAINLAEVTLTPPPRTGPITDSQSAKRRRSEAGKQVTPTNSTPNTIAKEPIPSIDIVAHMWLGFSIHEDMAIHKGVDIIREHRTNEEFAQLGTPAREITDFNTLRRAFPRVPQALFPNERPDAVPGNHLHFTQIPKQEHTDPATGLSDGFHITIRYDYGFKGVTRQDARGACVERLRQMDIPLGTIYSNPIDIGTNAVTKNWAGFIKVHLKNPLLDGIALLKGHRAFVMQMDNGEKVIGKIEKGYELASKARNLRLHLKGDTLRHEHASTIFKSLVHESYYSGHQHEFMGLTKPILDKNFAFLTLTTEEARNVVLKEGVTYNNERLQVSVTRDRSGGNPSELRISTTLVANNLPQREPQSAITKAIMQAFGEANVVGFSFGQNTHDTTNKHAGWCHIQCLNTAVYTEWIHKSTIILGRRIDFIPHRGSIDGSDPNTTAIRLAQASTREALAEKVQAMGNVPNPNPLITEKFLTRTMKEWEEKLDEKFGSLTTSINHNTDLRHDATTSTLTNHSNHLHALLGTIAQEFQQSNIRMQGIITGLSTAAPDVIQRSAPSPTSHGLHPNAPPLPLQAPPGFQGHPLMYPQGPHSFHG